MKKLVEINSVCNGSTGKIMCDIANYANKNGFESYCFFGRGKPNSSVNCYKFGNKISFLFHVFIARLGYNGYGSYFATKKMIRKLKQINPDVIHLHNIHGYYVNLKVLFNYLKKEYHGKIIWTLHDCWSFTGHCAYFTMAKCKKWKKECMKCPQLSCYPKKIFDTTKREYKLKKELFVGINNLTIVTPSKWLKLLVEQSFLNKYNVEVINNGIDLNVFKSTYDDTIYDKYSIPKNKKIILGVANVWEERKGLGDFLKLWNLVDKNVYQFLLVGVDSTTKKQLPEDIITIERTDNASELAKIYSLSHILFNPTYEDNYPTVNLESIACGTPIITYDTGGCKEQVEKFENGFVVDKRKYSEIIKLIEKKLEINSRTNFSLLDVEKMVEKYINIIQ